MTQLIDVEEKVREFEATKMNVKTINENGGHFIMVEVEDVRQGLAQILTQANTLHTQKVSDLREAVEGIDTYTGDDLADKCTKEIKDQVLTLLDELEK